VLTEHKTGFSKDPRFGISQRWMLPKTGQRCRRGGLEAYGDDDDLIKFFLRFGKSPS
jgi:hypothetical protein